MVEDYVLGEDEYEILEMSDPEPITSEEVKNKLESPLAGSIKQEDFDRKDYTIKDYLSLEEDQYPRNIAENKGETLATLIGAGVAYGAIDLISEEPLSLPAAAAGYLGASYLSGLMKQEMDIDTAFENSLNHMSNKLK